MSVAYFSIIDKVLIRGRAVIRESHKYFKVYLPTEYNDVWELVHREKRKVDFIVFLPESINYVDKILVRNRRLTREGERFKLYLPKKYEDIWERLCEENKRVDLLVVFR